MNVFIHVTITFFTQFQEVPRIAFIPSHKSMLSRLEIPLSDFSVMQTGAQRPSHIRGLAGVC